MKDSMKQLPVLSAGETIKTDIAPVLLSASVISAMAYIYVHHSGAAVIGYSLMSLTLACAVFALYEFLRRTGKVWLTVIAVVILMCIAMGSTYLSEKPGEMLLWFMEPSRFTQIYYGRSTSLVMVFGSILISCLYYFTRVRYRGVFVFLICLCPFCLFAKTFTEIPVIFPIIIMTLFFFIMTGNRGMSETSYGQEDVPGSVGKPVGKKGVTLAVTAFIVVVTAFASFAPKLEFAPYREVFDEFVTGVTLSAAETAANFTDFSDSSSTITTGSDDTVIFDFYGDNPVLLKRQCFNYYDGKQHSWTYYGDSENGTNNWWKFIYFEDPATLCEKAGLKPPEITKGMCRVVPASGNSLKALYTPENLTDITLDDENAKTFRTENDEYFLNSEDAKNVRSYCMEWVTFDPDDTFSQLFTDSLAEELSYSSESSSDLEAYMRAKEQAVRYNDYLLSDIVLAQCYSSSARRNEVRRLVDDITAGKTTPYGKAEAIEQYLLGSSFVYDKEFVSPDASPDYFILNSKRGTCTAYATAMTLMCREAGLTARYCEGFWVQKYDDRGFWYVTAGDGHAFVQVWLDGYGWTNFNPTNPNSDSTHSDPTFLIVGGIALLLALIGVMFTILRPVIAESVFVARINRTHGSAQLSLIYARINRMLNIYLKKRENTFTPTETADKVRSAFGYDLSDFTEKYENAVYGGIEPYTESEARIYLGFREAYRNRIKRDRKEKKARRR